MPKKHGRTPYYNWDNDANLKFIKESEWGEKDVKSGVVAEVLQDTENEEENTDEIIQEPPSTPKRRISHISTPGGSSSSKKGKRKV